MFKKILASVLSLLMLLTVMMAVPASAEDTLPENLGTDYVPGEITGNLITEENLKGGNYIGGWGGGAIGSVNDEAAWQITSSSQVPETANNANSFGVMGRIVSANGYDRTSAYQVGKNVVVSYQAKLDTGVPIMKAALYQYNSTPLYSVECPGFSDGVKVTNTEWQKYAHTFKIESGKFAGAGNTNLSIGLAYTGTTENRRGYWIKGGSVYVGQEYAYDIDVNADSETIAYGEVLTVDADVVNQGGVPGGINQGVAWYVLNSDRTAAVDGFTVTEVDEGNEGKATVIIDNTVAEGTYYIVAVADVNADFVKGIPVTVEAKSYADYVPDATYRASTNFIEEGADGHIGAAWSGNFTFGFNGAGGAGSMAYGMSNSEYYFTNKLEDVLTGIEGSNPVVGFNINASAAEGTTGKVVYSYKIRGTESPRSVVNMARINSSVSSTSASHVEYPYEHNGSDKGNSPTVGYKTYAGTFADRGITAEKYHYRFGFVGGTEKEAAVFFDPTVAYIGYEYVYDLKVTADKESLVFGDTMTVDADVVNQVGLVADAEQGVTWYAFNSDRTELVDGFTITEGENGTATVTVDNTVETGTYNIVAIADADEKLIKGVAVNVTKKSYEDYVAGSPANNLFAGFSNIYATDYSNDGTTLTLTTTGAMGDGLAGEKQERGAYGAGVTATSKEDAWIPGKTLVFGAKAKAGTGTPRVNFAAWQYSYPALLPEENPNITDGTALATDDWQQIGFTMSIPESGVDVPGNVILGFGFAETPAGETEGDRSVIVDISSAYLGIEAPYDIAVSADKTKIISNETLKVNATVLNQIGKTGNISQDVTWRAMNAARDEFVDGFTFTENADGSVTVAVADTVAVGTYAIVAVADADNNLVKGVEIELVNYDDYIPDTAERDSTNLIVAGTDGVIGTGWGGNFTFGFNGAGGAGGMDYGKESGNEYYFKNLSDSATDVNNTNPVIGFIINHKIPEGLTGRVVYSFDARAESSPKSVINIARINSGVSNESSLYVEYPEGFSGADDGVEPGTELATYKGAFADKGVLSEKYRYRFGFIKGTELNAKAYFDASTMYIGYEYAYDIAVTADKETVAAGEALTVDANVLNQLNEIGAIEQNVTWYALNDDRTALVDGFTFTEGENGTATVAVANTVAEGTYDLVAVSDVDNKLIKGVSVQVTEAETIEGITITKGDANVTVATDTALEDAKLIFVTYNANGQMVDYEIVPVTLDAQTTGNFAPVDLTAGAKTRVVLWNNFTNCTPLAKVLEY